MSLEDVLADLSMRQKYYETVLRKLKKMAEERGYQFCSEARSEWHLDTLAQPGRHVFYGVETDHSSVLGFVMVPEPGRGHSDRAWNRFNANTRGWKVLEQLNDRGWEGKRVAVVFVQVWEDEREEVLIPLKILKRLPGFNRTGDFTVKRVAIGQYAIVTPSWDDEVFLQVKLEHLFTFL
jgi:hypothetical protein